MKLTDKEGLEIASVVKDVLEGKAVKKEKKNVKEVEEPRAQGEKEFKKKHVIKKSGENPDGTVTKEASDKKAKYKAFFDAALKKFGVKSPAELEGDKKKEFFNYVDKNYEAQNEVKEDYRSSAGRDHFQRTGHNDKERGPINTTFSHRAMDEIKKQIENLKKAKASGNSKYDDATLNKIGILLGKEQFLIKKLEQVNKKGQKAGERGDDDAEEMYNDEYADIKDDIETIKAKIKDIKDKAGSKKEGVNEELKQKDDPQIQKLTKAIHRYQEEGEKLQQKAEEIARLRKNAKNAGAESRLLARKEELDDKIAQVHNKQDQLEDELKKAKAAFSAKNK